MRKALWLALVTATLVWSCSGGRLVEVEPAVQPEAEAGVAVGVAANTPVDKRLAQFEETYVLLACRANINYDAMASMGMIIEPWDQMQRDAEDKSTSLEPYLDILRRNGYENLAAFKAALTSIDEANKGWWDELTGRLFEIVQDCKKTAP